MTRNLVFHFFFSKSFYSIFFLNILNLKKILLQIDTDCEKCGEGTNVEDRWCKPCQIDNLKKKFVNWTSGTE